MAAKEMYDYLSVVTPDYTAVTLSVTPDTIITEEGSFNQEVIESDDLSQTVITLSTTPIYYVTLQWTHILESDAGTIYDFYFDTAKAKGRARSFYWLHPVENHYYVLKFAENLSRAFYPGFTSYRSYPSVKFRVLGKGAS